VYHLLGGGDELQWMKSQIDSNLSRENTHPKKDHSCWPSTSYKGEKTLLMGSKFSEIKD
jgi:hypothetical protein